MSFEPTSGYSTTRTSTVFSDGENQQRAEVVASLNGDWVLESYSTDKSSAVVTDGVNKQRAVVTYNLNGGAGSGGAGGDYLPLSGGTMTGEIVFGSAKLGGQGYRLIIKSSETNSELFAFNVGGCNFYSPVSNLATLGTSTYKWKNVYTKAINNGADIAIPTTGGTLARIEDIDEVVGNISTLLDAINGESI